MHDSIRALDDVKDYYIFTFVRNPFTRLQSAYQHGVRKGEYTHSFEEFLKLDNSSHIWLLPQYYFISAGSSNDKKVSFIGKYENIKNDIKQVFNKLNLDKQLPHLNNNPIYERHPNLNQENYYNSFYTEDWMVDCVRERYENDFKIFNYGMDI